MGSREWDFVVKKAQQAAEITAPWFSYCTIAFQNSAPPPQAHDIEIQEVGDCEFWYKGIEANLQNLDLTEYLATHNSIVLDNGGDGIQLFKRSRTKFWVLLGKLPYTKKKPFVIAIFYGTREPTTAEFLTAYANEVRVLQVNGYMFINVNYELKIRRYICDAPARAKIKCIIEHGGYNACEKCNVEGEWIDNRLTYCDLDSPLRSDESFRNRVDPHHHKGESPLLGILWKPLSEVPLDVLHLVYIGVYTRLLADIWRKWNGAWKFSARTETDISNALVALVPSCPSDFNRLPRPLSEMVHYTAKDFRRSLLSEGVLVFRDHQKENIYKHFLLLHAAMSILNHPQFYIEKNDEHAHEALRLFITHGVVLYGEKFVVYNVHNLIHLAAECLLHNGTGDSFSSFQFESRLGQLKRTLMCGYRPLRQAMNRDLERVETSVELDVRDYEISLAKRHHVENEILDGTHYKFLSVNGITFKCNQKDNCFQTRNGESVVLSNIVLQNGSVYFVGQRFLQLQNLYEYPFPSSPLSAATPLKISPLPFCNQIKM